MPDLYLTGNPAADRLLSDDPNALLIGMLLDQQVPMEKAFSGPYVISQRMGGLDVRAIAEADPEEFAVLCSTPPGVHRFPKSMAARIQDLCRILVTEYDGSAVRLYDAPTGQALAARIAKLPGFGKVKSQIFTALLGKQYGITPPGWEQAGGEFASKQNYSVADVRDPESLALVRASKKAQKAAAKEAAQNLSQLSSITVIPAG